MDDAMVNVLMFWASGTAATRAAHERVGYPERDLWSVADASHCLTNEKWFQVLYSFGVGRRSELARNISPDVKPSGCSVSSFFTTFLNPMVVSVAVLPRSCERLPVAKRTRLYSYYCALSHLGLDQVELAAQCPMIQSCLLHVSEQTQSLSSHSYRPWSTEQSEDYSFAFRFRYASALQRGR